MTLPLVAPSLGGVETLATRPVLTTHVGLTPQERQDIGIHDGLIRCVLVWSGVWCGVVCVGVLLPAALWLTCTYTNSFWSQLAERKVRSGHRATHVLGCPPFPYTHCADGCVTAVLPVAPFAAAVRICQGVCGH